MKTVIVLLALAMLAVMHMLYTIAPTTDAFSAVHFEQGYYAMIRYFGYPF
jgi:hypothetical protein